MGVYSLSKSSINNWVKYPNFAVGNTQVSDFELITTQVLSSTATSVSFTGLQNYTQYKHLQVRIVSRDTNSGSGTGGVWLQVNADTGNNYSWHRVGGGASVSFSNGSTSTSKILAGLCSKNPDGVGVFGASIIDILNFSSSARNKVIRSLTGNPSSISTASMEVNIQSGAWYSTAAITSLTISSDTSFDIGSRFSIYGVK